MRKAIILAAGEGRRLRPYTFKNPKCLIPVNGKGLLEHQLSVLKAVGIEEIILVAGYMADKLKNFRLKTYLNKDFADTNMVWTLFCAEEEMEDEVIVAYGDIIYSKTVLQTLLDSRYDISVVIDREWQPYWQRRYKDPIKNAETFKIDKSGKIAEIGKRPQGIDDIQGQYIGLMKFSAKGVDIIKETFNAAKKTGLLGKIPLKKAYMTDLLQAVIDSGGGAWPVFVNGEWIEVDTPSDLNSDIIKERLEKVTQTA